MDDLSDVSLIIKTFERRAALERLLDSIRAQGYGDCPVLVADDSNPPYRDAILRAYGDVVDQYVVLPHDSGVSKGRNELLKRVDTEYFVVNDDDFVYDGRTDLRWLRTHLEAGDLDILGGLVFEPRHPSLPGWTAPVARCKALVRRLLESRGEIPRDWRGEIQRDGDTLRLTKSNDWSPPWVSCEFTLQFFLARTDSVWARVGGWAEELKSFGEHWEFFYRAKRAGLDVGFTREVGVRHVPLSNPEYSEHRFDREDRDMQKALALHDLDVIEFHRPDGVRRVVRPSA
jgi:GT2 family glycosyltransferase